jgi:hypothetical protein
VSARLLQPRGSGSARSCVRCPRCQASAPASAFVRLLPKSPAAHSAIRPPGLDMTLLAPDATRRCSQQSARKQLSSRHTCVAAFGGFDTDPPLRAPLVPTYPSIPKRALTRPTRFPCLAKSQFKHASGWSMTPYGVALISPLLFQKLKLLFKRLADASKRGAGAD